MSGRDADLQGQSVCVVACNFAPESTGSAPYNTLLVETLADAGARVEVVTGVPHYPQWSIADPRYRRGIRWHERDDHSETARVRVRHAVPARATLLGRARMESSFTVLAAPYVRRARTDVVVAVTPLVGAMAAALLGRRGRPVGVIVHDMTASAAQQSGTAGGRASQLIGTAEYALLRRVDAVGVITPGFVASLVRGGVDPDRIHPLPIFTHVGDSTATSAQSRRLLGWPEKGYVVVHTGNMGMKQGLEHVLHCARRALTRKLDHTFVLVGDGNQRAALQESGADLPNVLFVPPVDEGVYPDVLAAADVLLVHERPGFTSSSLPSKLTSYAAAKRPIVAAVDPAGITATLLRRHHAAMTVSSGDSDSLLDAIERVRMQGTVREALVAGAAAMAAAEFSDAAGRDAFRGFVRGLTELR